MLKYYTKRFATLNPDDNISPDEREIWEYFSSLYKNSNKGIKGRGKDRRISQNGESSTQNKTISDAQSVDGSNRDESNSLSNNSNYGCDGGDDELMTDEPGDYTMSETTMEEEGDDEDYTENTRRL
jgi:hypothetical protein